MGDGIDIYNNTQNVYTCITKRQKTVLMIMLSQLLSWVRMKLSQTFYYVYVNPDRKRKGDSNYWY